MTADEGTANALPEVPPDWVALSDLPGCVARWYGVSMTVVAPAVVDAVWTGELYPGHRIAGIKPDGRWRWLPDGLTHTGVQPIHDPRPDAPFEGRIVAYDWAAADVDRRKGTVGGWPQKSGVRERLLIELPWVAVKDWAGPRVKRWKKDEARLSRLTKAASMRAEPDTLAEATRNKWMADYVRDKLTKRDDALTVCRKETGCTYRQALAAWKALPATAKRNPRQTDRAMSGHSALTTK